MGVLIKKITQKKIIGILGIGSLFLSVITRFILGGYHINLSNLASQDGDLLNKSNLISTAHADTPSGCSDSSSCSDSGGDSGDSGGSGDSGS